MSAPYLYDPTAPAPADVPAPVALPSDSVVPPPVPGAQVVVGTSRYGSPILGDAPPAPGDVIGRSRFGNDPIVAPAAPVPAPPAPAAPIVPPVTAPTPPAAPTDTGAPADLPPAAPPTPSHVRAPGPGGGAAPVPAAPAAPAPAPGAESLAAFDAASKKEEAARDAVYKAEQQTLADTAAQTTKNNAERLQQLQDQKAAVAAQKIKSDAAEKAASVPFHEFQLSTGRTILSALGMILGGFSYDPHHVNNAVQIYQDAIKQDFDKQKADHENLWKTAQKEIEAGRQLSTDQLQEMKEYEIQRAEKLSAILAKGQSLAAFSKNELGKAQLEKTNVGLRQGIEDASRNASRLDRAQKETERHDKSTEGIEREKLGIERAKVNLMKDGLTPREQLTEANNYIALLKNSEVVKSITEPKTGIAAQQRQMGEALDAYKKDPSNPLNQVGLMDAVIKNNTGRAAVIQQYKLYAGHAAGANDTPEQLLAKFGNGGMSKEQQKNLVNTANGIYGNLQRAGGEANRVYHETVDRDVSTATNPFVKKFVAAHERATFGQLSGYGSGSAPAATPAAAPAGNVTVVKNRDGSTSTYDASGKLIK